MPEIVRTFRTPLDKLEQKINIGFFSSPLTYQRGRLETIVNGVKSVLIVYEQHAEPVFVKPADPPDWMKEWDEDYTPNRFNLYVQDYFQQAPHYSISIMLVEDGEDIHLRAITSGSGQEHLFIPDSGAEFGLFETLDITLENLDKIIL